MEIGVYCRNEMCVGVEFLGLELHIKGRNSVIAVSSGIV